MSFISRQCSWDLNRNVTTSVLQQTIYGISILSRYRTKSTLFARNEGNLGFPVVWAVLNKSILRSMASQPEPGMDVHERDKG